MKKLAVGSILGAIVMFVWQFLSFALLDLHREATQYTPKQAEILNYLGTQLPESGSYYLPNYPDGASSYEMQKALQDAQGKPWAIVSYHKSLESNMAANMIRGVIIDLLMIALLCWIIAKINNPGFATIVLLSIAIGMIVFFSVPYTNHIWYQSFDLTAYLIDAIAGWGLVGLTLGLVFRRSKVAA